MGDKFQIAILGNSLEIQSWKPAQKYIVTLDRGSQLGKVLEVVGSEFKVELIGFSDIVQVDCNLRLAE